jgi:SAM-dependent methyltransferase
VNSRRPGAPEFHQDRPDDLRSARRWQRFAHISRSLPRELERLAAELAVGDGDRILDYGCAELPYRSFFSPLAEYVGADLPGNPDATVEIAADGTLPVADAGFDAVLSTQVLEHVADPATYLAECARVLRPGGRMLLSTHGIMVFHPDPVDYWRWTAAGLERVVSQAGLEVVRLEGIVGLGATGIQLFQESLYYRVPALLRAPLALVLQTLAALADRFESAEARRLNALVFTLVAEKPQEA